jgi:1-deoxy-D-xylulose-5-phosphate reductoisomerase
LSRDTVKLVVLGSTGSVGVNTLDVAARFPDRFEVLALAAGWNVDLLIKQAEQFRPRKLAVFSETEADALRKKIGSGSDVEIVCGPDGYIDVATLLDADCIVSAMVGAAGLRPTWAAVRAGKRVALANKETLVMAGEMIMAEAKRSGAEILPVDSEHSAIFQVLCGQDIYSVRRLIITASGGPFLNMDAESLSRVTAAEALNHPKWDMGAKISIDSATLMNKGLEAIEARWLFGLDWDRIDIHIHSQAIVHSLVEFVDGSVLAQLGLPDMRVPIAYALSYPARLPMDIPGLNLFDSEPLTFHQPDMDRFPCLALALEAGRQGGTAPAVLNAANEIAVEAFLNGRISFPSIADTVRGTLDRLSSEPLRDLDTVFTADEKARAAARDIIGGI